MNEMEWVGSKQQHQMREVACVVGLILFCKSINEGESAVSQKTAKVGDSMSEKMAISMFGQKRLSREGGIEIVVKELCTRMAQKGYCVTCFHGECEMDMGNQK